MVAYCNGQQFKTHHDAGTLESDDEYDETSEQAVDKDGDDAVKKKTWQVNLVAPRRLATIFVYLNSLPKGQGATAFPLLDIEVIWPSPCPELAKVH